MSKIVERLLVLNASQNWQAPETGLSTRHASAHLLVLMSYVLIIASFPRYAVLQLIPLVILPALIFQLCDMPVFQVVKRLIWIEPFIVFVALMNPIFSNDSVTIGHYTLSMGWLIAVSIIVKSLLTLTVALQVGLILGMGRLAGGLQALKVPPVFIEVISLSYRYLIVLMEEALTLLRAYQLRAPHHNGIQYTHWGSFAGNLILRSFDRAVRIEQAMAVRGNGSFRQFHEQQWQWADSLYIISVFAGCMLVRFFI